HLRAAVRISELEKNPRRLYYDCPREKDKEKCKFWDWCNPIGYSEPNFAFETQVQLRSNDDARLGVIEINMENLKHIINIIVFFCGLALVVSV
ncbi:hypothetical protein Q8G47_28335, partial [Klebsiella pneumoniae]|uniref:hypothetical protein n=1 Tax=Klebsiella pneumoniae TaxID=573 RepID=UPI003013D7F8